MLGEVSSILPPAKYQFMKSADTSAASGCLNDGHKLQGASGGSGSGAMELLPKAGPEDRAVTLAQGEAMPVGGWALHASSPGAALIRSHLQRNHERHLQ